MREGSIDTAHCRLQGLWDLVRHAALEDAHREQITRLELYILLGQILSNSDVVAKLRVLKVSLASGPRTDGADMEAVESVTTWFAKTTRRKAA